MPKEPREPKGQKLPARILDHLFTTRIDLPWGRILTAHPHFAVARIMQLWPGMEMRIEPPLTEEDNDGTVEGEGRRGSRSPD